MEHLKEMKWAMSNEEDIEVENPGVIIQTILTVLKEQPFRFA
jgi:hypothetical protein